MGSLIIVKPAVATAFMASGPSGPTYAGASRLNTPPPKEAFTFPASSSDYYLDYDMGVATTFDSFLVGYHNATAATQTYTVQALGNYAAGPVNANLVNAAGLPPLGYAPPSHSFARAALPVASRYWRVTIHNPTGNADLTIGVVAMGLAFQTAWGEEFGGGRLIEDTGVTERLFGGGWGIDEGVAAGGYQWTFGDLQPEELRTLYQLLKERRTTRTLLVVENPDQTDGLTERVHWGLMRKLEAYERLDPLNTKWALTIGDWA